MRNRLALLTTASIVLVSLVVPEQAAAQPEPVEILNVKPVDFSMEFIFIDSAGTVTRVAEPPTPSGLTSTPVPVGTALPVCTDPWCLFPFVDADIVGLNDTSTGIPLLPTYDSGFTTNPALVLGRTVEVTNGTSPLLPFVTITQPPDALSNLTDAQIVNGFPLFTGTAEITSILSVQSTVQCPCDLDSDPDVNIFDLLAYLALWFELDPFAERDAVPGITVFDLLTFLECWFGTMDGGTCL